MYFTFHFKYKENNFLINPSVYLWVTKFSVKMKKICLKIFLINYAIVLNLNENENEEDFFINSPFLQKKSSWKPLKERNNYNISFLFPC